MSHNPTQQRIEKLKQVINHHRYLRHVLDKQEISENALDSLKKELFDLEQQYPQFVTADSPTQRVEGKTAKGFAKALHKTPMFSLNDAFFEQDIIDWQVRIKKLLIPSEQTKLDYFCEVKVDGLAVSLIYEKGVFVRGATRGNGKIGEDITNNLKTIESIPLKLRNPVFCEVRGEAYITKKDFALLNKEQTKKGEAPFANPRNTAAGALRQLNPKVVANRRLSFLAWQLSNTNTQENEQKLLQEYGFKPALGKYCQALTDVFGFYNEVLKQRDKLPYQIDGIVVSVNNSQLFGKLGVVGKAPRGAIAYKFPLKQTTTIIKDIKLQVGRTGAITPVAVLGAVNIGGSTITRATLHNEDEIKRLDVRVGDTVIVGRAGDVIPQVIKVLKDLRPTNAKPFAMPSNCPICQTKLIKEKEQVALKCPNKNCQVKQLRQIYHFVSKTAFDIDGLGPKIVEQLMEQGLIADAGDLFFLQKGDLLPLKRFAEKAADNLINEIANKKHISSERFIYALGILNVGIETAIDLAKHFSLETLKKADEAQLTSIKDIGPIVAKSIYGWFHNKQNIAFLNKLKKAGIVIKNYQPPATNYKLSNKVFVLTGTLTAMPREQAKQKIRVLGGEVTESISKNTTYLVAGANPGSKLARARTLGVKILNEPQFLQLINN